MFSAASVSEIIVWLFFPEGIAPFIPTKKQQTKNDGIAVCV